MQMCYYSIGIQLKCFAKTLITLIEVITTNTKLPQVALSAAIPLEVGGPLLKPNCGYVSFILRIRSRYTNTESDISASG